MSINMSAGNLWIENKNENFLNPIEGMHHAFLGAQLALWQRHCYFCKIFSVATSKSSSSEIKQIEGFFSSMFPLPKLWWEN